MKSQLAGTVRWSSPEVLRGVIGIEGDVWAWGLLAWEVRGDELSCSADSGSRYCASQILTGTHPYPSINGEVAVIVRILESNSGPLLEGESDVPKELQRLLERCWERNHKRRVTISMVLQELHENVSQDAVCICSTLTPPLT